MPEHTRHERAVVLNAAKVVDVKDTKNADGPIALQYGAGTVKFGTSESDSSSSLMKDPACQGRRQKGKGRSFSLMPYPFSLVGCNC